MATKKFIIEVEEGRTDCELCPFSVSKCGIAALDVLDCRVFNLATMKITEYNEGEALLYAVEKTAERTKREVIQKAVEWFEKYLFDIGYPDDWCRDSPNLISGRDRFIKAMNK